MHIVHVELNNGTMHTIHSREYTLCLKNAPTLTCYNFDMHQRILVNVGQMLFLK